jgi:hypothetical protein
LSFLVEIDRIFVIFCHYWSNLIDFLSFLLGFLIIFARFLSFLLNFFVIFARFLSFSLNLLSFLLDFLSFFVNFHSNFPIFYAGKAKFGRVRRPSSGASWAPGAVCGAGSGSGRVAVGPVDRGGQCGSNGTS